MTVQIEEMSIGQLDRYIKQTKIAFASVLIVTALFIFIAGAFAFAIDPLLAFMVWAMFTITFLLILAMVVLYARLICFLRMYIEE